MMVLPILAGLLGLGAAGAAGSRFFSDYMDERAEGRQLERRGEVWRGIMGDAGGGGGAGGAGPGMGILGDDAPAAGGGFLGQQGVPQMPDMLGVANGLGAAGYMEQALPILQSERLYGANAESATTAFNRSLERDEIQQGYAQSNIAQQQGPAWARLAMDRAAAASEQGRLPVYEGAAVQPEQYMKWSRQDAAVDTLAAVRSYADRTTAADRLGSEEAARLRSEYQMTVLPVLQELFDAKSMQEGEYELFKQIGGDPLALTNLGPAERGKVSAVINKLESQRQREREAYGVPYVPRMLGDPGAGGGAGGGAAGGSGGPNAAGLSGG